MAITKTQIAKWNRDFSKLTKAKKRIAVAKDVILQIKNEKYIANRGNYINEWNINIGYTCDIQSNFDKIKNCTCCALGSALLSITKFTNKLKLKDLDGYHESNSLFSKQLTSIFSPYQQALIESAFEHGNHPHAKYAYNIFLKKR